jgi:hypothetical protein
MDRALDVDLAKERLRQAADEVSDQVAEKLIGRSPNSMMAAVGIAAGIGLLLGRSGRMLNVVQAALPTLLDFFMHAEGNGQAEKK